MGKSLHARMMLALGDTVLDPHPLRREVLLEAHDLATGRVRSEMNEDNLVERLGLPDPTDEELRTAIAGVLDRYRVHSSARAKIAFEVLEPLLN